MVMRINVIITEENMLWSFNKFSQPIFQEIYEGHPGEFVCWSWCLKGSKNYWVSDCKIKGGYHFSMLSSK